MTGEDFVGRINVAVHEASVSGIINLLVRPSGRRPEAPLVLMSKWYNELSPSDKDMIRQVVRLTSHCVVFQMLSVLDNVVSIHERGETAGELAVVYKSGDQSSVLNGPGKEFLHDIFGGPFRKNGDDAMIDDIAGSQS